MPALRDPLMIVTDLDGSLLDHHTYSWEAASPWLARLKDADIPVVICSSKTAAEIEPLQRALNIFGSPFIAENGAVVKWQQQTPAAAGQVSGKNYPSICETLQQLRQAQGFKFTGFADVTEKEVADWTGLSPHDATLAKMREGSESLIWRDTPEQFTAFQQALAAEQLKLVQGGRFWHVMNQGRGKGAALDWLLTHYPPHGRGRWITIGLGDGPNDAPMLEKVDYAVVIKGYSKTGVTLTRQKEVFYSAGFGPEGWSEGLTHYITG
ncbi:mannosyl-3-phosphoglycerate phosphatase-related protein [Erwinia sp.]|uniref:mannosyl-3-phosphoglycerate phosphatase-related protein n=1 Tax=Erwinia citreus TaxID=558 RepID=UPI0028971D13|nr:mannosyl-3-phosphoglycerate phosphatase-related protein [Erwinia sp.]